MALPIIHAGAYPEYGANKISINGVEYSASGVQTVTIPEMTAIGTPKSGDSKRPISYGYVNVPVPFTPPDGWGFKYEPHETTGTAYTIVSNVTAEGVTRILGIAFNSTISDLKKRLLWRLVKM